MAGRQWSLRNLLALTTVIAVIAALCGPQVGHGGFPASYVLAGIMIGSAVLAALGLPALIIAFAITCLWRLSRTRKFQQTRGRQFPTEV